MAIIAPSRKGVRSDLIVDNAFGHMDDIFAETSYDHPYVCT